MILVESIHSRERLVNGGIGSPSWSGFDSDHGRIGPPQPRDEAGELGNINFCPAEALVAQIFPEQLEVVSRRPDRVRTSIQVMQELEVGENRLDGNVIVVKDEPAHSVRIGKVYLLYLHRLHSFHQRID